MPLEEATRRERERESDGMSWSIRVSYLISFTHQNAQSVSFFFLFLPLLDLVYRHNIYTFIILVYHLLYLVHLDVDMIYTKKEIVLYYNLNYPEDLYENQTQALF